MRLIQKIAATHLRRQKDGWTTLRKGDIPKYKESVWDMYVHTYTSIGMGASNPNELMEYDVWKIGFHQGTPVVFNLYKSTKYGLKSGLSGFDGSPAGKTLAVANQRSRFHQYGVYGEVSHKAKGIALAAGSPVVCPAYVGEVLSKTIKPADDGISYTRNITGIGTVEKVMVGQPKGIPTTDPKNPQCPPRAPRNASGRTASEQEDWEDLMAHYACMAEIDD